MTSTYLVLIMLIIASSTSYIKAFNVNSLITRNKYAYNNRWINIIKTSLNSNKDDSEPVISNIRFNNKIGEFIFN